MFLKFKYIPFVWSVVGVAAMVEGAQGRVLQRFLSLPDPGQFPPFFSVLLLVRDLALVPPPQGFEQDDQFVQGPQTQFTGKNSYNSKLNNHNLNFDEHLLDFFKEQKNWAANLIQMFMAYLELHNSKKIVFALFEKMGFFNLRKPTTIHFSLEFSSQ